jgi:hypothetical protein
MVFKTKKGRASSFTVFFLIDLLVNYKSMGGSRRFALFNLRLFNCSSWFDFPGFFFFLVAFQHFYLFPWNLDSREVLRLL